MMQALWLALWLGSAAPPAYHILMTRDVSDELGALADSATVEHVRCLFGVTLPDTMVIFRTFEPQVREATPLAVGHEECPGYPLAIWHNHLAGVTITGEIRKGWDPRHSCYLSRLDLNDGSEVQAPKLQFVQVDRDTSCWWTQLQIVSQSWGIQMLPAMPGQRSGFGDTPPGGHR